MLTKKTAENRSKDLSDHGRQQHEPAIRRRGLFDGLEPERKVVADGRESANLEKDHDAAAEDDLLLEYARRDEGSVLSMPRPRHEQPENEHSAEEQPEDGGRAPRISLPAPAHGQQEHDDCGDKDGKAGDVEFVVHRSQCDQGRLLDPLLRHAKEEEDEGGGASGRQEDPHAWRHGSGSVSFRYIR